jgi:serine/threonine protein kinase
VEEEMGLSPGLRLGPYEILSPIGTGGMGEVYKAEDTRLHRTVAVKVLPSHLSSDAERRARFEREARAASALNHPNITTVYDIGQEGGTCYIVMEFVEGKTLRELVGDGPLSTKKIAELGTQIADGLAKAHKAGITHRDLKPENLMVTDDGLVKILDFGLAKIDAPEHRCRFRDQHVDQSHRAGSHSGHPSVHVAGTGGESARRFPLRPVFLRIHPLRDGHGKNCLQEGNDASNAGSHHRG